MSIIQKSHTKSKIVSCHINSHLYARIEKEKKILQIMAMTGVNDYVIVEYIDEGIEWIEEDDKKDTKEETNKRQCGFAVGINIEFEKEDEDNE